MPVATCNRLFQISSETRTIEIDDSIVRRHASDTERDRESYTEVCDVCLSRPIILDVQACPILTSAHLDRGTSSEPIPTDLPMPTIKCNVRSRGRYIRNRESDEAALLVSQDDNTSLAIKRITPPPASAILTASTRERRVPPIKCPPSCFPRRVVCRHSHTETLNFVRRNSLAISIAVFKL
jgi:hypothetical protein